MLRAAGHDITVADLGGGLGVPYDPDLPPPPSPDEYGAMVRRIAGGWDVRLVFEPGRLIVGNAGVLLTRVIRVKPGAAHPFLIVDAAMNDLMRPALYDAWHAIEAVAPRGGRMIANVVGPVCETGDTFATAREMDGVEAGDLVLFRTAGAYAAAMSSTYNSRPLPPEVLVNGDSWAVVRERTDVRADRLPDWLSQGLSPVALPSVKPLPIARSMARIVMKFGGTSMAGIERIRHVASLVKREAERGNQVAVVVSAMAGETDRLVQFCREAASLYDPREYDVVVASGEQVTSGLLAITLQGMGAQRPLLYGLAAADPRHAAMPRALIDDIDADVLERVFDAGGIAVIPGFQGVTADGDVATLGRGGSDTSAVALAAAMKADRCDIYTDVDGVYTTDPRIVPRARKLADRHL